MSYVAKVETEIRDLDCLKSILTEMGHEVKEGGTIREHNDVQEVDINCGSFGFKKNSQGLYVCYGRTSSDAYKFLREYAHRMVYSIAENMSGVIQRDDNINEDILMEIEVG